MKILLIALIPFLLRVACETDRLQTKAGLNTPGIVEVNGFIADNAGELDGIFQVRACIEESIDNPLYAAAALTVVANNDRALRSAGAGSVWGYRHSWRF